MRLNRWLPIVVALVGIGNIVIVGRWYALNRLVRQPLEEPAASTPLAIGLRQIDAALRSGQIMVTPTSKSAAVKNAVSTAVFTVDAQARESHTQIEVSRDMFKSTVVVFAVQLALAILLPFILVRREPSSS